MAVAPEAVHRVESVEEVMAMPEPAGPVAFLAQTTLAVSEWEEILAAAKARWPDLWVPGHSDLCFATTNRQAALRAIAGESQVIVVIGSANSSNTRALERTALAAGTPRVLRVNGADELPDDLSGVVGVIAGASAPEYLVEDVVRRLAPARGVEEIFAVTEDEYFPLPRELRDLLRILSGAVAVASFAPGADPAVGESALDDRELPATEVLASLTSVG
jgi:4-hydroxy-3-methylbut-2-enyl diphosphate reductase